MFSGFPWEKGFLVCMVLAFVSVVNFAQATKEICDLKIEKTSAWQLVSGQQVTYTLKITNVGTASCPGPTQVTDTGAPGLSFVSAGGPGWVCVGSTCTYLLPIPAGGTATVNYTYLVTAPAGTKITNCATVSNANDRNLENNRACLTSEVVAPPGRCDLTCSASVNPDPLISGGQAIFTITVTNVGTMACAQSNQVIIDPTPGLQFVSSSGSGWTCQLGTAPPGQVICNYPGSIPPNSSVTLVLTYSVTATPGTWITFCSKVANKNDTNTQNNQCCVRVPVEGGKCDLTCRKLVSPSPLVSGQVAQYTIVVINNGTAPCPGPTTVYDVGGPGLQFVSASGPGWTCVGSTCTYAPPIPGSGGTASVTYTFLVTAQPGEVVANCAYIKSEKDSDPTNNRCCTETPVGVPCDLRCEKKIEPLLAAAGYKVTVTITNAGLGACPGPTTVTEHGIPGLTLVSASGSGWTCAGGTCTLAGPIPPGGTAAVTYTYVGALPPGTILENCVTIENNYDIDVKNNCCAAFGSGPTCCCHLTYLGGVPDDFAPGETEPHNPPPEPHPEQTGPFVGFDGAATDQWFGHRFSLPQGCTVTGVKLEIRVKPLGAGSDNDSLVLRIGGTQWLVRFGPPGTALQTLPWNTTNFPTGQTFTLDLGSLPGGGSLLSDLNNFRLLDVMVQDDTSVDYVTLVLEICNCP